MSLVSGAEASSNRYECLSRIGTAGGSCERVLCYLASRGCGSLLQCREQRIEEGRSPRLSFPFPVDVDESTDGVGEQIECVAADTLDVKLQLAGGI